MCPLLPFPQKSFKHVETILYKVDKSRSESSFQINISQVQFFSHFK